MSEEKKSINNELNKMDSVSGGVTFESKFSVKEDNIDNSKEAYVHGTIGGDITLE